MLQRFLVIFCFGLGLCTGVFGQQKLFIEKDLRNEWLQYEEGKYVLLSDKNNVKSIHFNIDANQFAGDYLNIKSANEYFLFVNGKVVRERQGHLKIPIDSLAVTNNTQALLISVYQSSINEKELKTFISSSHSSIAPSQNIVKPNSFFKDFVIIAGLTLIILFVVMIRLYPKLASDYFSVAGILSLREGEDNQSHVRFAISSNVLFYVFCSMLLSLFFLILFYHLPDNYLIPLKFRAASFGGVLWQWVKLSLIVLFILLSKILIVFSLSNLFGMRGIAGMHFFNWIRLLLVIASALSTVLFIYFISRGYNETVYIAFLSLVVATLLIWIAIVFLKLNYRTEHSMFHLFSYICATEIIPLLITIKVLFQ